MSLMAFMAATISCFLTALQEGGDQAGRRDASLWKLPRESLRHPGPRADEGRLSPWLPAAEVRVAGNCSPDSLSRVQGLEEQGNLGNGFLLFGR